MKTKSYFSRSIEDALAQARLELGPEAMLVHSRKASPEVRHLGEYEVRVAEDPDSEMPAVASTAAGPALLNDRLAAEVSALKQQLEGMRRTLTKNAFAPAQWLAPALAEAYAVLTAAEVSPELARDIVQAAGARSGLSDGRPESHLGEKRWRAALEEEMRSRFRVEPVLGGAPAEARPRIVALLGPPGAGKTTTLVKLAVNYGLASRRSVMLLSVDTYRVAAAEQLRYYGAILGVGFQVLETVASLAQAIEECRAKDLIFIDTAGLGLRDLDSGCDLARFLSSRGDIDRQLVLPSSMKSADLSRMIEAYEIFQPRRLLFTRLDETTSVGPVFNEAVRTGKPLSFFATAQRIPEDLEVAVHSRLIEPVLSGVSGEALSAA